MSEYMGSTLLFRDMDLNPLPMNFILYITCTYIAAFKAKPLCNWNEKADLCMFQYIP